MSFILRIAGTKLARIETRSNRRIGLGNGNGMATTIIRNDGNEEWQEKDRRFERLLMEKGCALKEIEGDGNCLFRAVADQVWSLGQ